MIVGSPRYMSPEQAKAEPVDRRSDIYSMGCVLFGALAGRGPFDDRNGLFEFCQAHVFERPPALRDLLGRPVDPKLEAVVQKAMAKDPGARYQTAALFAEDLRRVAREIEERSGVAPEAPAPRTPRGPQTTDVIETGEGTRFATVEEEKGMSPKQILGDIKNRA